MTTTNRIDGKTDLQKDIHEYLFGKMKSKDLCEKHNILKSKINQIIFQYEKDFINKKTMDNKVMAFHIKLQLQEERDAREAEQAKHPNTIPAETFFKYKLINKPTNP